MNYIIVDDHKMARVALKQMLDQYAFLNMLATCESPFEAMNVMQKENVDVIFLDIQMPGMSGLDFLKSLQKKPHIVLVSAKPEYALESYEYNVVDYLLKPVKEERLLRTIQRLSELSDKQESKREEATSDFLFVREKGVLIKVQMEDILFVQALGDYITLYTPKKKYVIHMTLRAIEDKLPPNRFMRVHRSYMLALDKIDSLEGNTAFIDRQPVPIGEQFRSPLLKRMNLL